MVCLKSVPIQVKGVFLRQEMPHFDDAGYFHTLFFGKHARHFWSLKKASGTRP